jgi:putative transcriptional regulator
MAKTRKELGPACVLTDIDVRAIRDRQHLTQIEFSERYGIPVWTLRKWEQEERQPDTSALILLTVIDREPDAVMRALRR